DTEKSRDELIVDSGCTFHMIPHQSWFITYESFNGGNVYMRNHYICPVIGKGNIQVKIHDGVVRTIMGVRHVPDLKRNMISLTTLEANGCKYSREGGVMKIFKGALVLMKAIQSSGLYVLQSIVVYSTAGVATSKASLDDFKLWHYRLGHMGEKGMKNLAKKGLIKVSFNLEFCEHSVFGKQKKHKDEVFLTFKEWNVLIENQTGKKIKKLRTDNGLEFCGERFNALCRKTIMEKVRCMLSHANLDKDFWGEDVTTAAYLINRSLHRSLDGNIPEILWSGNSVDYSDLKVFRCPVYVHVNEGKLVSRAVKRIFLGYGSGVKGYRVWCPDPKYRKIIHSIDVTFNEDVIINSRKDFVPPHNVDNNHIEDHIENCEPTNYLEAISSPECDKWVVAIEEEVENGIPGVESNRYKARYVVRGFDQCEGIDFNEVFFPVVRHTSIRVLLSIVALQDLELEQLDVKTTFLHGHLEEEIYVEQPDDGSFFYLVLYVDDMLIAAPNKDQIRELKDQLSNEFDMKYLGAAKRILDMEIRRNRKIGKLTVSQTDYISKVLKKFNMISCKPVPTPLAPHFKLSSHECPKSKEDKEDMSRVSYSSAVGSLMYAMVYTRPDLAHAISVVSRYMHNPGKMHWEAAKCIIRYLKGTSNIGLSFEKSRASPNRVVGYVDSDYAVDLDARKSLFSHIFSHCGSAISWYSSLQAITALSTTKAEYISSTEGVKEAIWLRGMVNEFGLP
nr:retrovirus-related Pol polyprotein from transposon TNT 1-94 [Tanacetum cinerariifolium]